MLQSISVRVLKPTCYMKQCYLKIKLTSAYDAWLRDKQGAFTLQEKAKQHLGLASAAADDIEPHLCMFRDELA